ncbi:MAG: hypothetical protein NTX03_10945 [Bacteroidetes bacterium]|nr:hypothetical protein [Bacteroidota bacterium]
MIKKILLISFLSFLFFAGFSQNKPILRTNANDEPKVERKILKEFSTDTAAFVKEIKTFFTEVAVDDAKKSMFDFLDKWKTGGFSLDEQQQIIAICNKMLKVKMRPYPDFQGYFNNILMIKNKKLSSDIFNAYSEVLGQIIEKQKKEFRGFNESMFSLFQDQILADNGGKKWRVSSNAYLLEFKKEPTITFSATDLQLYSRADTMSIYTTSGIYYINTNKWRGTGGNVYWARVGFGREKASVKLKKYYFDLRTSDYSSDSAELTYPSLFKTPVLGRFSDKVTATFQGEKASYPRFSSYQNVFKLNNVFQNINYYGGFSLEGAQIIGKSADSTRAMVTVFSNGKLTVKALARSFVIAKDKLVSSKASITIYIGDGDSIYHPQCIFNYNEKTRRLTMARKDEGVFASPFFNSYHQLEFSPDNIIWDLDSTKMNLKSISNTPKDISFESSNFFNIDKMLQLQGILDYNPITKLKNFFDKNGSNTATIDAVAGYFGNTPDNMLALLILLSREGYIFYDIDGKTVTQKNKLAHYERAANKGEDFDVIKFISNLSGRPNGVYDMNTKELTVLGVSLIKLSDSQQTYIIPLNKTVKFLKNRDMVFNGMVHSGRFNFWGNGMYFDYDSFKINLDNIDSLKFKFPEFDDKGNEIEMHDIQNTIQKITGFLYIDKGNNKSGKKPYIEYPIFRCTKESYVYYDKKSIYGGVYLKDSFFFRIDPFVIENLDHFTAE